MSEYRLNVVASLAAVPGAIARTLQWRWGSLILLGGGPLLFWLFLILLVKTTPGNDLAFQLHLFRLPDYLLLGTLSLLLALLLAMQLYVIQQRRDAKMIAGVVGRGGIGGLPALLATILGTASCSACVASIFGWLGIGGILFLLDYRWWFVAASLVLMGVTIVLTARTIEHACAACEIR